MAQCGWVTDAICTFLSIGQSIKNSSSLLFSQSNGHVEHSCLNQLSAGDLSAVGIVSLLQFVSEAHFWIALWLYSYSMIVEKLAFQVVMPATKQRLMWEMVPWIPQARTINVIQGAQQKHMGLAVDGTWLHFTQPLDGRNFVINNFHLNHSFEGQWSDSWGLTHFFHSYFFSWPIHGGACCTYSIPSLNVHQNGIIVIWDASKISHAVHVEWGQTLLQLQSWDERDEREMRGRPRFYLYLHKCMHREV